jgi:AMP nucleosidase
MKSKLEIVQDWLPRYTGMELNQFGKHILLVNFDRYLELFASLTGAEIQGADKPMPSATFEGITMINFGMGSANAATIMDLLSAIQPEACILLGKCGGLKRKNSLGDLILPIAAIRGEGTSDDYFPPEVPAMPAFNLQKAISTVIRAHGLEYWTGTVFTTNRRVWEYDSDFKEYLRSIRVMAIDMESATIFTVGFANRIPTGAIMLVSDQPMISSGVKTSHSDREVDRQYSEMHIKLGVESLQKIIRDGIDVRHLYFDFRDESNEAHP